jgi:D-alanine-D-alanine ligase
MPHNPQPDPAEPRELRILVLHNSDFDLDSAGSDADVLARADVVGAAQDVARALAARGHFAEIQGVDADDLGALLARLKADPPDLVFNLVESLSGDARHHVLVPGLLELMQVPYTGSTPLPLALALHKFQTKQVLRAAGLPTPAAVLLPAAPRDRAADIAAARAVGYPLFLKLATEDGSLGITSESVVHGDEALLTQLDRLRGRYTHPILAERYIAGRELYVSLVGNDPPQVLPLLEMDFSRLPSGMPRIVSYDAKWKTESAAYQGTVSGQAAPVPPALLARIEEVARLSCVALEVTDYARCDFRLADDGTPYVLEVNPNCDLSDGAGFSKSAALAGIPYEQLVERIALAALARCAKNNPQPKDRA